MLGLKHGSKNDRIVTGMNESRSMFGLTWFNPESFVTDIGIYIHKFQLKKHYTPGRKTVALIIQF